MAPIKFEENLKEKLEQRTINPSAKSWEMLAERLEAKEEKKGNTKKFWFAIAASVVGILFMYKLYFMPATEHTTGEHVVDVEHKIKTNTNNNTERKQEKLLVDEENTNLIVNNTLDKPDKKIEGIQLKADKPLKHYTASTTGKIKNTKPINDTNNNTVNKNYNDYYVVSKSENDNKNNSHTHSIKLEENATATLQAENIAITDNELDTLLKHAKSEIENKKPHKTVPLDYNALLQDVEDDLEESFRDKLLRTVKGGYHTVKNYVAERNE